MPVRAVRMQLACLALSGPLLMSAIEPPARIASRDVLADLSDRERGDVLAGRTTGDALSLLLQRAVDTHHDITFPSGVFRIGQALVLHDGQHVRLSAGTEIRQDNRGAGAFAATGARDVTVELNGGTVRGPGGWTREWRGNQGWPGYEGLLCTGCTRFAVVGPGRVINWGHAAIAVIGGHGYTVTGVTIEGTHRHGTPLTKGDNFQNGIYVSNDVRWGPADGGRIVRVDISGTGQGILREAIPGGPAPAAVTVIDQPNIHDMPGQHAIYNMDGAIRVIGGRYENLAYSAVKFQSGDATRDLFDLTASGIVARNIGGSMFEMAALGQGSLNRVKLQGTGTGVGYLLSLNGKTRDFSAVVTGKRIIGHSVYVLGNDIKRTSIKVTASDIEQDGILVVATNAQIDLTPKITNPNRRRTPEDSGIRVYSPSAQVTLHQPMIRDAYGNMTHGIFNQRAGSQVRVVGALTATGAAETAVHADGEIIGVTKTATLSGARGRTSGRYPVR